MAATEQYFNPIQTFLSGDGLGFADVSATVSDASLFPVPGLPFRIIIELEICMVTAIVGNVMTLVRGLEGTTAEGHSVDVPVVSAVTAGALAALFVAQ